MLTPKPPFIFWHLSQASRESLHSSVNGTGLPPTEEPSPAKGPDGTNIRDSALHDPFAQFNSLRSSNEVRKLVVTQPHILLSCMTACTHTPAAQLNHVVVVVLGGCFCMPHPHAAVFCTGQGAFQAHAVDASAACLWWATPPRSIYCPVCAAQPTIGGCLIGCWVIWGPIFWVVQRRGPCGGPRVCTDRVNIVQHGPRTSAWVWQWCLWLCTTPWDKPVIHGGTSWAASICNPRAAAQPGTGWRLPS